MPNWCLNRLDVYGPNADVAQFFVENACEDGILTFEASVPAIEPTQDWGTKWDACEARPAFHGEAVWTGDQKDIAKRIAKEGGFGYFFETAWAPPSEWMAKVAVKYQNLDFRLSFVEPGMDFMGEDEWVGGQLIDTFDSPVDFAFTEKRGLLEWPRCHDCNESLSEDRANGGDCYCPVCEENLFMKRGKAA